MGVEPMKSRFLAFAALALIGLGQTPVQAQGQQQVAPLINSLTLEELQGFLQAAEYRVLAGIEETKTLRVQGGEDPPFYVQLEQCSDEPEDRCTAITMLSPDEELVGVSDSILLDANRGFSGLKIVTIGPEKTIFYRRYLRLAGGISQLYLLRQLVAFEAQYKNVAQHLRERAAAN